MGNVGGAKAATVGGIAGGIYGNAGSIISRGPAVVVATENEDKLKRSVYDILLEQDKTRNDRLNDII